MGLFLQLLTNGMIVGSIYAMLSLGFALVFNTAHIFHLAHGAVFVWGAYIGWWLARQLELPMPVAIIGAIVFSALMGVAIEWGIYRPLRRRNTAPLVAMLASFGLLIVLNNLAALVFSFYTKKMSEGLAKPVFLGSIVISNIALYSFFVAVVLFLAMTAFLYRTKMGTAIRAIANNPVMATAVGISFDKVMMVTYAVGSAAAGVAAVMTGLDIGITPYVGFDIVVLACIAVIMGGVGSIPGAALGGLFVGIIRCITPVWLPTVWQELMVFAVLLVFMYFRPRGFLGKKVWKAEV